MNRDMSTNEVFQLRLEKTYYERGFFNVTRDFDHFVRSDDGPISLQLGDGWFIEGYVNRRAQGNGTARVMGGARLREWFQQNYTKGDTVPVTFVTASLLVIG